MAGNLRLVTTVFWQLWHPQNGTGHDEPAVPNGESKKSRQLDSHRLAPTSWRDADQADDIETADKDGYRFDGRRRRRLGAHRAGASPANRQPLWSWPDLGIPMVRPSSAAAWSMVSHSPAMSGG
jgi:hypothetical protein